MSADRLNGLVLGLLLASVLACSAGVESRPLAELDFDRPLKAVVWDEAQFTFSLHDESTAEPVAGAQVTVWFGDDEAPSTYVSSETGRLELAADHGGPVHIRAEHPGYHRRVWLGLPRAGIALGLAPRPEPGGQLSVGCPDEPCWTDWTLEIRTPEEELPAGAERVILGVHHSGRHYLRAVSASDLARGLELHPLSYSRGDEDALVYLLPEGAVALTGEPTFDGWFYFQRPTPSSSPGGRTHVDTEDYLLAASVRAPHGGHHVLSVSLEPLPRSPVRMSWSQPEPWLDEKDTRADLLVLSSTQPDAIALAHPLPTSAGAFELSLLGWPNSPGIQPRFVAWGYDRPGAAYSQAAVASTSEGLELGPLLEPRRFSTGEGAGMIVGEPDRRATVCDFSAYGGDGRLREGFIIVNASAPISFSPFLAGAQDEVTLIFAKDWMLEAIDARAGNSHSWSSYQR